MNPFSPATIQPIDVDTSGHYSVSGVYQGRKFIVDEINPHAIEESVNAMLDDIALRAALDQGRRMRAQPNKPWRC